MFFYEISLIIITLPAKYAKSLLRFANWISNFPHRSHSENLNIDLTSYPLIHRRKLSVIKMFFPLSCSDCKQLYDYNESHSPQPTLHLLNQINFPYIHFL